MASDILKQDWNHLRREVKTRWHALEEADIKKINGNRAELVSALEDKYYFDKDIAEKEVNLFLEDVAKSHPTLEHEEKAQSTRSTR